MELLGEGIKLVALRMNGKTLSKGAKGYTIADGKLRIANAPDEITLEIETLIHPEKNTTMMGLYVSNGNFFTQCEAEGFRKITYFPDRPDVMAKYTVMLRGDKKKYPVLLSNGNLIEQGDLRRRPPLCEVGRPVQEAVLSVCAGGGQAGVPGRKIQARIRPQGAAAGVGGAGQSGQDPACDGVAQAQHTLG